jgi:UBX domain-containing protein 1
LGDLTSGANDSEDDDDDESQDFFAGGEKSGLAVQNPDDLKKKIIEKAKKYVAVTHPLQIVGIF